ncbi:MAG: hypothetical protein H6747_02250 [Deltaproteobacteria bacterium]|nr:hypothetical protein [Deltaproteobacteria bacterium]
MSDRPLRLGLIGQGIGHSLSPMLHRVGLAALGLAGEYVLFEAPAEADLDRVVGELRAGAIDGANVTTPYKRAAAQRCDEAPPDGAPINTLWRDAQGRLVGSSSDGPGLCLALRRRGVVLAARRVAILGTGGAAESVGLGLRAAGAELVAVVGRRPAAAELVAGRLGAQALRWDAPPPMAVDLLVHATRIGHGGRADDAGLARLHPAWWAGARAAVDLVYATESTAFERFGMARGANVLGGIGGEMLAAQAAISLGWWTGHRPPFDAMRAALLATRNT